MPLKTIPVLCEKSDLSEFALGPEPIIKFAAWEAATLEINFISAAPDLVVFRFEIRCGTFCARLIGSCVEF